MGEKLTKAWAVVAKGKIVADEKTPNALLIFDSKWRARAAIWLPDERVEQVTIGRQALSGMGK